MQMKAWKCHISSTTLTMNKKVNNICGEILFYNADQYINCYNLFGEQFDKNLSQLKNVYP